MNFEKSAGAIIFRKNGDKIYYLLLCYPLSARSKKDYWDLPKGHIEDGEKEIDTVRREVKEETGIEDLKFVEGFKEEIKYFFNFQHKIISKTVVFYLAETETKDVEISFEHIDYEWLLYEKAIKQLTFENAKQVLKRANEFRK